MNYIFLMDPLDRVIPEKDTTLALMVGAHRKGHKVYYLFDGGIVLNDGKLQFHVTEVIPQFNNKQPFIVQERAVLPDEDVHVVFIRTDPPFGEPYLQNTWLLDHLPKHIPVINSPNGIRTVNEKIWAAQFTPIIPKTFIGRIKDELLNFILMENEVIAKPTDGFGGQSVFHIKLGERNSNVILETLTRHWTKDIILQKYVPQADDGDKRILLLDGEPLGCVLRVHSEDDHRNNFLSGGKPAVTKITQHDEKIIDLIKPELIRLGLYFVGIDVIGDYLIEVNVTSPTCLQEMNKLTNKHLENEVIEFSEKLVDQLTADNRIPLWKE